MSSSSLQRIGKAALIVGESLREVEPAASDSALFEAAGAAAVKAIHVDRMLCEAAVKASGGKITLKEAGPILRAALRSLVVEETE